MSVKYEVGFLNSAPNSLLFACLPRTKNQIKKLKFQVEFWVVATFRRSMLPPSSGWRELA